MIVRAILGDIPPESLGVTYCHEHLIIDSEVVAREWPQIHLPSAAEASAELETCAWVGVSSVIDAMPTGSGRNLRKLAEVSSRTGVNVVASTGMHIIKYYEGVDWVDEPEEQLAGRFTTEILDDADSSGFRAGIIKIASSARFFTDREKRLFAAAALTHHDTGAPILTHCEGGIGGIEQVELLMRNGVGPERVILSHTDKVDDPGYHRDLLDTGANVVYDQGLRDPTTTVELIVDMWETGIDDQILLGTDGARRTLWSTLSGSPGLAWLRMGFIGLLRSAGLEESQIRSMFVDAPRRVLSFDPPR